MNKGYRLGAVAALICFVFLALPGQAQSLQVGPLVVRLDLSPGQSTTGTIVVGNSGEKPEDVTISLQDFDMDSEGSLRVFPPETLSESLAPYVSFSPSQFVLATGEQQEVTYEVNLPPDAASGPHWAVLIVEENRARPVQEPGTIGFNVNFAFAARLLQTDPLDAVDDGEIVNLEVQRPPAVTALGDVAVPQDEVQLSVVLDFANLGTTFLDVQGTLSIIDDGGKTVQEHTIRRFAPLPDRTQRVQVDITERLPVGRYLALVVLDTGQENLIGGQVEFEIFE